MIQSAPHFFQRRRVLPGFSLTFGFTLFYVTLLILLPFAALAVKAMTSSTEAMWAAISGPRAIASYQLTIKSALIASSINCIFGLIVAWILVRFRPPFAKLLDCLVDLPFALPSAVGGIALTAVLGPEAWLGKFLNSHGIQAAFSPLSVTIAMLFVGLPFVVRSVQPVLEQLDPALEEAAYIFGATNFQTFVKVLLPPLLPAVLTGFALAFARGLGEYGAVIFISGNIPMQSEVTATVIAQKIDQHDLLGAAAVAMVMLAASFLSLFAINLFQAWSGRWRNRA